MNINFRECECCAEASDCAVINYLWLCEKCVNAYLIEFEKSRDEKNNT